MQLGSTHPHLPTFSPFYGPLFLPFFLTYFPMNAAMVPVHEMTHIVQWLRKGKDRHNSSTIGSCATRESHRFPCGSEG